MLPVTIVIAGEGATDSCAVAGSASTGFSLAAALAAPFTGRLVDRFDQRRAGRALLAVALVALVGLVAVVVTRTLVWTIVPRSVVAGLALPKIGTYTRVRWRGLVTGTDIELAQALESLNDEVNFFVGPAGAAVLAAAVAPVAPIVLSTVAVTLGALPVTGSRVPVPVARTAQGDGASECTPATPRGGRLDRAALVLVMVGLGMALNGVLVTIVATAQALGDPGLASVLFAVNSAASVATALVVGRLRFRTSPRRRITVGIAIYGLTLIPFALAGGAGAFVVACALAGAAVAPTFIQVNAHFAATSEPGRVTEAFSWISATVGVGLAIGAALVGEAIDRAGPDVARLAVLAMGLGLATIAVTTDGLPALRPHRPASWRDEVSREETPPAGAPWARAGGVASP
jgi:MFS family permease